MTKYIAPAGLVVFCIGMWLFTKYSSPSKVVHQPAPETVAAIEPPPPPEIQVHVAGEVINQGIYKLPIGSNVNDAINAAGGPTGFGDIHNPEYLHKDIKTKTRVQVSLAQQLNNGARVYVPASKAILSILDDLRETEKLLELARPYIKNENVEYLLTSKLESLERRIESHIERDTE